MIGNQRENWKLGLFLSAFLILLMVPDHQGFAQSLSGLDTRWLEERDRSLKWGRDPFLIPQEKVDISKGKEEVLGPHLSLSAIIYRDGSGIAIINNKIMRVGDVIEKMELTGIMEDRITLRGPGGEEELRVNKFALER
ncbi:MAG: hypothetical protein AABZ05_04635 [Nitrospirota bacterium]